MIGEMIVVLFLMLVVSPCMGMVISASRNKPVKLFAGEHGYLKVSEDGTVLVAVVKPSFRVIPARVDMTHVRGHSYGNLGKFTDYAGKEWVMVDGNPIPEGGDNTWLLR